ncbi:hypothetical protein PHLCEN_2v12919 [Hermanssonia centrifuga]|uniref:Uncharacterized protein n=1 Tax=Hermanssonia centrifuga TaxID=98765 RepID=A0A2R6NFL7_9APHY|nr:hypothetical protein PHLCEN_2v12919 [Hermanssonia centrifuga]
MASNRSIFVRLLRLFLKPARNVVRYCLIRDLIVEFGEHIEGISWDSHQVLCEMIETTDRRRNTERINIILYLDPHKAQALHTTTASAKIYCICGVSMNVTITPTKGLTFISTIALNKVE